MEEFPSFFWLVAIPTKRLSSSEPCWEVKVLYSLMFISKGHSRPAIHHFICSCLGCYGGTTTPCGMLIWLHLKGFSNVMLTVRPPNYQCKWLPQVLIHSLSSCEDLYLLLKSTAHTWCQPLRRCSLSSVFWMNVLMTKEGVNNWKHCLDTGHSTMKHVH